MKLGAFSISLTVKDIHKSFEFYQKLGFTKLDGNIDEKWLILQNESTTIGLFQDMLPKNTLTFNPGWNSKGEETEDFTDIRKIQKELETQGVSLETKAESESGPAFITLTDPDGNPILIDQHR